MKILVSNVCSAFSTEVIGSRVTDPEQFMAMVNYKVSIHPPSHDRIPGQHKIILPASINEFVSSGVGKRSADPSDYVLRVHRGKVNAYLRREKALPAVTVSVVVYTREAYLSDPDVLKDEGELSRIKESDCTHVLVAILASTILQSPLTPQRFVSNLAGGNKEALTWNVDEIRAKAKGIASHWEEWDVVAD